MGRYRLTLTLFSFLVFASIPFEHLQGQDKRPFRADDYTQIEQIQRRGVSGNGQFVWHVVSPMEYGDPRVIVHNMSSGVVDTLHRADQVHFGADGSWMAYVRKPAFAEVRAARFSDSRAAEKFHDTLVVVSFQRRGARKEYVYDALHRVLAPSDADGLFIMFLLKDEEDESTNGDTLTNDGSHHDTPRSSTGRRGRNSGNSLYRLMVLDPSSGKELEQERVKKAWVSAHGKELVWAAKPSDSLNAMMLWRMDFSSWEPASLYMTEGSIPHAAISWDEQALAVLEVPDTGDLIRNRMLLFESFQEDNNAKTLTPFTGMRFNEHHSPYFLERTGRLIMPLIYHEEEALPETEADSLLPDERFRVDVWAWNDPILQSQQLNTLRADQRRAWHGVLLDDGTVMPIETTFHRRSGLHRQRTGERVLVWDDLEYAVEATWMGISRNNLYLYNLSDGTRTEVARAHRGMMTLSPDESFIIWYVREDSAWYGMTTKELEPFCITCDIDVDFFNPLFDRVGPPPSAGLAGWADGGRSVLLNTRFDIWKFDLTGERPPVCLTSDGYSNQRVVYRHVRLDPRKLFVERGETMLLSTFDIKSKEAGYARYRLGRSGSPEPLISGPYRYRSLQQSRDGNRLIWHRESFTEFPELWTAVDGFRRKQQLSHLGSQYDPFYRGTVELVRWEGPNGMTYEGKLYLPENRKPDELLPMIVYFYERGADRLHWFSPYTPSRSVINKAHYLSHGYAIFEPDIHYGTGHPGDDALQAVLSGTRHILSMGIVDSLRLGIQGQSWGGYQVAYIITQTDLFKAAMAGAAVSNMTSAYGAIRWESGRPRLVQYELGQSRLGATLWEQAGFLRYFNNSPLFFADQISTPLLMMHNDEDGAVPWAQSVELYLAMRRLEKPCWLLVYNNEAHNLRKWPNRVDLSIRMKQFFDHYLMNEPMPVWMADGIPALDKGTKNGYEFAR